MAENERKDQQGTPRATPNDDQLKDLSAKQPNSEEQEQVKGGFPPIAGESSDDKHKDW